MKRRFGFFLILAAWLCLGIVMTAVAETGGDHEFSADGDTHYCMNEMHREMHGGQCSATHENGKGKKYGCKIGCCAGHKNKWKVTREATCTTTGKKVPTCKVCGKKGKSRTIAKLGHKWYTAETVAPTYTQKGYTLLRCSVCNATTKENYVPAALWALYGGAPNGDGYRLTSGTGNRIYATAMPALAPGWTVAYDITLPDGSSETGTAEVAANAQANLLSGDAITVGDYSVRGSLLDSTGAELGKIDKTIRIVDDDRLNTAITVAFASPGENDSQPASDTMRVVTANRNGVVNLREGPTTDAAIIGELHWGDEVTIVDADAFFYKITTQSGLTGYIASEYLSSDAQIRVADGMTETAVTAMLRDADGNPLSGKTLYMSYRGAMDANAVSEKFVTDDTGTVAWTMANTGANGNLYNTTVRFPGDEAYCACNYFAIVAFSQGSGQSDNGWVRDANGGWTYWKDGKQLTGWIQDGGTEWFYIDPGTGTLKTGWFTDGGSSWYYAFTAEDASAHGAREGAMAVNCWIQRDGSRYYVDKDGAMVTNQWVRTSDSAPWSYVGADGKWQYDA